MECLLPHTAHLEGCGIEAGVVVETGCDENVSAVTLGGCRVVPLGRMFRTLSLYIYTQTKVAAVHLPRCDK